MSTRRRRADDRGRQSEEADHRRPSRTGALRKSRQQRKTRTTIVIAAMAALCVPLALWIYPKITSGTLVSRLASVKLAIRSATSAQLSVVSRSHETAANGTFAVHLSCRVYNGTTEAVSGVVVTLTAVDAGGGAMVESTARPSDFVLDGRASRIVEVRLAGLTEEQIARMTALRLASRFD